MSRISCQTTPSYSPADLDRAVAAHFAAMGEEELRPGIRVLLKMNMLRGVSPETAITTHPALVAAVARYLRSRGITEIVVADSPGGTYTASRMHSVYRAIGLGDESYSLNEDFSFERVHKEGTRGFNILTPIAHADLIINLPKLKTHGMTVMSGAVKNLFGAVPGLQKPELHCLNPDERKFSEMLLELADVVAPAYTIIDAVDAMEGDGPSGGTVCSPHLTIASRDLVALDWFCAEKILQVDPRRVPYLALAEEQGRLKEREVEGEYALPEKPFLMPEASSIDFAGKFPKFLQKPVRAFLDRALIAQPKIDRKKCVGCGKCAESCPQHIITVVEKKAQIDRRTCISCFCCQEMCPVKAIGVRRKIKL